MNSVLKCFSQGAVNLHHSYLAFGTPNAFGQTHPQWPRASLHVMFWAARLTGTYVRLVHPHSTPALTNAQYSQEHYTWSPNSCRVTAPLMSSINQCCPPNHHVMLANMPDQPPQRTPTFVAPAVGFAACLLPSASSCFASTLSGSRALYKAILIKAHFSTTTPHWHQHLCKPELQ